MLGEIVVDDEHVFPLIHEVFRQGASAVRGEVLQWHRIVRRGADHAGIVHRAALAQRGDDLGERGRLLPDRDVDADHIAALLVENGVDRDRRLSRLPVPDDQFALPAPDRDHAVYRKNARLQGLVDLAPVHDGGSREFYRAVLLARERAHSVQRLAERIHDPAQKLLAHAHLHRLARGIGKIAVPDFIVARKKNGADAVLFQVERQRTITAFDLEKFVILHVTQTGNSENAVA